MRHTDHNKCAVIEKNVLAHGLLRRTERVTCKIVAKHHRPLSLAHAFIGLHEQPPGCRRNAKSAEVVVREKRAGGLYWRAVGQIKCGLLRIGGHH